MFCHMFSSDLKTGRKNRFLSFCMFLSPFARDLLRSDPFDPCDGSVCVALLKQGDLKWDPLAW